MLSGVPQGSILGPLLFILYINDLPGCLSTTILFSFADDTKILLKIQASGDERLMQKDIQALAAWSTKWSLKLNPNNYKCGLLRFWNDSTETNYQLKNATITHNSSIKDLGITISNDLSWISHYKSIIAKAYKSLGLIHHILLQLTLLMQKGAFIYL